MKAGVLTKAAGMLVAGLVASCSPGGQASDRAAPADTPAARPAETPARIDPPAAAPRSGVAAHRVEGVVEAVGTEPMVSIVVNPPGGTPVQVSGALASEIRRLTGATVAVTGDVRPDAPWPVMTVAEYEVTSIDGRRPFVGVLQETSTGLVLHTPAPLRLVNPPEALMVLKGAKVYILGTIAGDSLAVNSFGVIRR